MMGQVKKAVTRSPAPVTTKWTPQQGKRGKAEPLPPPPPNPTEFTSLVNDSNQFSEECDKFLRNSTAINSVYAPFFVRNMLAMMRIGAADLAAFEIERGIKLTTPPADDLVTFAKLLTKLMTSLQELNKKGTSLTVVDRIYIKKGFEITPSFVNTLRSLFGTDIQAINFASSDEAAKEVNNWFQEASQHQIPQMLGPNEINPFGDHSRLVLLSAIHFEAEWQNKFLRGRTHKAKFYISDKKTIECPMMVNKAPVLYADLKAIGCHALGLPFMDGQLVMIIITSKFEPTHTAYKSNTYRYAHDVNIGELVGQMVEAEMEIQLPRFTLESTTHFIQPLKHLGMRTLFDPTSANFSGITGYDMEGLYISDVLQKVIVEFNDTSEPPSDTKTKKKGARAFNFATPFGRSKGDKKKPKRVVMNHPFVFHIVDKLNCNLILFSGLCSNPTMRVIETRSAASQRPGVKVPLKYYKGYALRNVC